MSPETISRASLMRNLLLAALALLAVIGFLTLGARGSWSFILAFRGTRLAAILIVACAIAVSTVLFQTITNNRILTPAIMGFDALYVLLQTVLVFLFGASAVSSLDQRAMFLIELTAMLGFSLALYRLLFGKVARDIHLLVLVGIVIGILFRSLSGFMQRIINPDDFVVLQDRIFASFNITDTTLVGLCAVITTAAAAMAWRMHAKLDVMALGRDISTSLGVDYTRTSMQVLALVAVLISVSTALVGPVTFFGLLVANLAYQLTPSEKHRFILPAATSIAIIALVGGQTILERVFKFDTALSIIVEFAGGLFFILFLLRGRGR